MSQAEQIIAEEIIVALQLKISAWQADMSEIEVMRRRQERKEERYQVLASYVDAALAEIEKMAARSPPATQGTAEVEP